MTGQHDIAGSGVVQAATTAISATDTEDLTVAALHNGARDNSDLANNNSEYHSNSDGLLYFCKKWLLVQTLTNVSLEDTAKSLPEVV